MASFWPKKGIIGTFLFFLQNTQWKFIKVHSNHSTAYGKTLRHLYEQHQHLPVQIWIKMTDFVKKMAILGHFLHFLSQTKHENASKMVLIIQQCKIKYLNII